MNMYSRLYSRLDIYTGEHSLIHIYKYEIHLGTLARTPVVICIIKIAIILSTYISKIRVAACRTDSISRGGGSK